MFNFLSDISKKLVIFGIVSVIFVILVATYLYDHQLDFFLDQHPVIAFCILGDLILQPICFFYLAFIIRSLKKNLFDYDMEVCRRIKDSKEKSTPCEGSG